MTGLELGDLPDNEPRLNQFIEALEHELEAVLDGSTGRLLHLHLKEHFSGMDDDDISTLIRKIAISVFED